MNDPPTESAPLPLVVIAGMHRSGTSYVAQVLNAAGFNLGDDVQKDRASDNLCGHWESVSAVTINEQILDDSGGSWCELPDSLFAKLTTRSCIERYLDWVGRGKLPAFKDPRLTITLPVWRDYLQNYRFIGCLRHPVAVAHSLQVRQGWSVARGLGLWLDYNRRLLDTVKTDPTALVFDYDADPKQIDLWFVHCFEQLGLSIRTSALRSWKPLLRHHESNEVISNPEIRDLYDELKAITQFSTEPTHRLHIYESQFDGTASTLSQGKVDPGETGGDVLGMNQEGSESMLFSDLVEVHREHDQIIQQLDRRTRDAEAEGLRHFQQQKTELRALERWTHQCYQRLASEFADDHARSKAAYNRLSRIAEDHEAILNRINVLNRRCDKIEKTFVTKFEQFTNMLDEVSGHLATCNQAFTAINNWLPLRAWRGLRKTINAVLSKVRPEQPERPAKSHDTPPPHWIDREATSDEKVTSFTQRDL